MSDVSMSNNDRKIELCLQEGNDDDVGVNDDYVEAFEDICGVK